MVKGGDLNSVIRKTKNSIKKVGRVAKIVVPIVQNPVLGSISALPQLKKRDYKKLPPDVRNLLSQVGEEKVQSIKIVRTPIESFVKTLMNIISLGQFESAVKASNYDNMFHLALFINGKYTLDKQAVISFIKGSPIKKDSQVLDVEITVELTINDLFEKTRELMGDKKFTSYSSKTNNCQNFVESILTANNIVKDEYRDFIVQDAQSVFSKMPKFTNKLANVITDIGAVADNIIEGEGKKKGGALSDDKMDEFRKIFNQVFAPESLGLINADIAQKIKDHRIEPINIHEGEEGFEGMNPMIGRNTIIMIATAPLEHLDDRHLQPWIDFANEQLLESKKKKGGSNKKNINISWKEYVKQKFTGKKFSSRQESNEFMKKIALEYKHKK